MKAIETATDAMGADIATERILKSRQAGRDFLGARARPQLPPVDRLAARRDCRAKRIRRPAIRDGRLSTDRTSWLKVEGATTVPCTPMR